MRSYPIFRLLVVIAALAIAGIAVWNVSHPAAVAQSLATEPSAAKDEFASVPPQRGERQVKLELTYSQTAEELHITALGRELIAGGTPKIRDGHGAVVDIKNEISTITLPNEAVDLVVKVRFKDKGRPGALRVRCLDPETNAVLVDTTLWGDGEIADTVTVGAAK